MALEGATNATLLDGTNAQAATFNTNPVFVANQSGFSITGNWTATGTPAGTFKIQYSNDTGKTVKGQVDYTTITNWVDVPSGGERTVSVVASGAGSGLLNDPFCMAMWVRVVYTRTSGSITPALRIEMKTV